MVGCLLVVSALFPATYREPQVAPETQPRAVDWQVEKFLRVSAEPAVYPPIVQVAHSEGSVRVQFVVGTDGTAKDLTYLSGPPLLMGLRQIRFAPGVSIKKGDLDGAIEELRLALHDGPRNTICSLPTRTCARKERRPGCGAEEIQEGGYRGFEHSRIQGSRG
jgi:hypothetical protein